MKKLIHTSIILVLVTTVYGFTNADKEAGNTDIVQMYISAYEEEDSNTRMELINQFWTDSSQFKDPVVNVTGRDEFNAMIETFRNQIPGLRVESTNHFSTGLYRSWKWQIYNGNDQLILTGFDFAELNEENKFIRVYAWFNQ